MIRCKSPLILFYGPWIIVQHFMSSENLMMSVWILEWHSRLHSSNIYQYRGLNLMQIAVLKYPKYEFMFALPCRNERNQQCELCRIRLEDYKTCFSEFITSKAVAMALVRILCMCFDDGIIMSNVRSTFVPRWILISMNQSVSRCLFTYEFLTTELQEWNVILNRTFFLMSWWFVSENL